MERPERADPAAEHAAHDQRDREQTDRPEEAAVDGVRREHGHRADERIREEERLDRQREAHGSVRLRREASVEARLEEEVHEDGEEADLRRATDPHERADALARGNAGARELGVLLLLLGRRRAGRPDPQRALAVRDAQLLGRRHRGHVLLLRDDRRRGRRRARRLAIDRLHRAHVAGLPRDRLDLDVRRLRVVQRRVIDGAHVERDPRVRLALTRRPLITRGGLRAHQTSRTLRFS